MIKLSLGFLLGAFTVLCFKHFPVRALFNDTPEMPLDWVPKFGIKTPGGKFTYVKEEQW